MEVRAQARTDQVRTQGADDPDRPRGEASGGTTLPTRDLSSLPPELREHKCPLSHPDCGASLWLLNQANTANRAFEQRAYERHLIAHSYLL